MNNNNQALIDGLRQAAEYFEARPNLPTFRCQTLMQVVWTKDELKDAARQMGNLEKKFTDFYFSLIHQINEALKIDVYIARETVCKKIVTWDCPDDESLLKFVEENVQA